MMLLDLVFLVAMGLLVAIGWVLQGPARRPGPPESGALPRSGLIH